MLGFFKKDKQGTVSTFTIQGMHCVSCSLNIDGSLEDLDGVYESKTSYAKGMTTVRWNPEKTSEEEIQKTISSLGYTIK